MHNILHTTWLVLRSRMLDVSFRALWPTQLFAFALVFTVVGCTQAGAGQLPRTVAQTGSAVQLSDGPVRGQLDRGTRSFIGIPYAAAPIGKLRWKPPHAPEAWTNTLDASGPGVACFQAHGESGGLEQSEDCLRLNVFAPEKADGPVPVLVFLHGGGNVSGSANDIQPAIQQRLYDGASFREYAREDVVVVTLNYRLGALGFLAHPALAAEEGSAGNYGLLDQQAALRWVHDNIGAFGGDPNQVTLMGQGAGASDVCYQLLAPDAAELIHAVVLESGTCGDSVIDEPGQAYPRARAAVQATGCAQHDEVAELACLRELPATELLDVNVSRTRPSALLGDDAALLREGLAVVDGEFMVVQPQAALVKGRFPRVPLIVGSNTHEGSYFLRDDRTVDNLGEYTQLVDELFGNDISGSFAENYLADKQSSTHSEAAQLITESFFMCPVASFADTVSRFTDVYVYTFNRAPYIEPLDGLGVTHGAELLWVWDVWPRVSPYATDDVSLSLRMHGYWSRLVSGDPNVEGETVWPRYDSITRPELLLNLQSKPTEERYNDRCERSGCRRCPHSDVPYAYLEPSAHK